MITTLHIRNIGIIEEIVVDLGEGLNVLTGETGAGKSLVIDALNIIAGGRFSKEMMRKDEKTSLVEICIYEPNHPIAEEGNIIVSREIFANGRNLCKINGRLVTVTELRDFMKEMIDIHGQMENQKLMDIKSHLFYLDQYAGEELLQYQKEYNAIYQKCIAIKKELKQNYGDEKEKQRALDLLRYQLEEIVSANLIEGEEEILEEKRKVIQNAQKISDSLISVKSGLNESILPELEKCMKAFQKIEDYHERYAKELDQIQNYYYDLLDLKEEVADQCDSIEFEEEDWNQVQDRIELIHRLKRKYGNNISEILEYQKNLYHQVLQIENNEQYCKNLKKELRIEEEKLKAIASGMSQIRKETAVLLENRVNQELMDLEMKNAKFYVQIKESESYHLYGKDSVEFMISTNVGEEIYPLIKIASGGELSRIMLAMKVALLQVDPIAIMIFDEIDTGISGSSAKAVSDKLQEISKKHQIICVTHLAVIAAKAMHHYLLKKKVENGKTQTIIHELAEKESIEEIARISAGEINQVAIQYAISLKKSIVPFSTQ